MKLSRNTISTFLVLLTLASNIKIVSTFGYYTLFTEDFIERLCENKNRPELNCDGKCALAKILIQESNNDPTPISLDWLKIETVLFFTSLFSVNFLQLSTEYLNIEHYTNLYDYRYIEHIAHPPKF
ncbi:hypothetical protein GH721_17950 [Kriegella sp. EG-1]|nr:hypothetical protein [Flavobacteriaceae bacterium EG-1]